jgi:uncharacterized protein YndB with AHSA1/START domain
MGSSRVVHAEARTTIRRPTATVFRWLTDPALVPQWVTGLVASRPVGAAEVRLGARSVEEVSVRGRTISMKAEIVELEDGRVIASRIETPDGPLLSRFVLNDLGDACSLTHTLTAEMSDHRWIPSKFIAAGMTRQIRRDLADLTRLVEATP